MADLQAVHRELLGRWRRSMNLVGPGEIEFHFEDCAKAVGWLQPTGHWVDLGTGAGFPGLVFAARFPEVELDLVDSRWKRSVFLEEVLAGAERLDGPVSVLCKRVETLPDRAYDGVMARGFAPVEVTLAHASRLLRPGGTLLLLLQEYTDEPQAPGFEHVHTEHYAVQGKNRKAVALRWKGGRPLPIEGGDAGPAEELD